MRACFRFFAALSRGLQDVAIVALTACALWEAHEARPGIRCEKRSTRRTVTRSMNSSGMDVKVSRVKL